MHLNQCSLNFLFYLITIINILLTNRSIGGTCQWGVSIYSSPIYPSIIDVCNPAGFAPGSFSSVILNCQDGTDIDDVPVAILYTGTSTCNSSEAFSVTTFDENTPNPENSTDINGNCYDSSNTCNVIRMEFIRYENSGCTGNITGTALSVTMTDAINDADCVKMSFGQGEIFLQYSININTGYSVEIYQDENCEILSTNFDYPPGCLNEFDDTLFVQFTFIDDENDGTNSPTEEPTPEPHPQP